MLGRYEVPTERQHLQCRHHPETTVACRHSLQLPRSLTQRSMGSRHPAQASWGPACTLACSLQQIGDSAYWQ